MFIGMITHAILLRTSRLSACRSAHAQDVDATVRFAGHMQWEGGRLGEGLEQTGSAIASYVS